MAHRVATLRFDLRPSRVRSLRVSLARAAPLGRYQPWGPSAPRCHSSPGSFRQTAAARWAPSRRARSTAASSHGVSLPSAVASAKDLLDPGFPTPGTCVFGVPTSLDALLPFAPPGRLRPGRSWDCDLQGLPPPEDPRTLSDAASPPGITLPDERTLAMTSSDPTVRGS